MKYFDWKGEERSVTCKRDTLENVMFPELKDWIVVFKLVTFQKHYILHFPKCSSVPLFVRLPDISRYKVCQMQNNRWPAASPPSVQNSNQHVCSAGTSALQSFMRQRMCNTEQQEMKITIRTTYFCDLCVRSNTLIYGLSLMYKQVAQSSSFLCMHTKHACSTEYFTLQL